MQRLLMRVSAPRAVYAKLSEEEKVALESLWGLKKQTDPFLSSDGVPLGKTLFTGVDFGINMQSRIALVGANGTEKLPARLLARQCPAP